MIPAPSFLSCLRGRPAIPVSLVLGIALALAAFPGPAAEAADPFYERRLREGTLALEQGRPEEASRRLEIAAVGLHRACIRPCPAAPRRRLDHAARNVQARDATNFGGKNLQEASRPATDFQKIGLLVHQSPLSHPLDALRSRR